MAWRRPGDKPYLNQWWFILLTNLCVTRPRWYLVTRKKYLDIMGPYYTVLLRYIVSYTITWYFIQHCSGWGITTNRKQYLRKLTVLLWHRNVCITRHLLTADHREQNNGLFEIVHWSHGCLKFVSGLEEQKYANEDKKHNQQNQFHPLRPNDAYRRRWTLLILVQIMACRMNGGKHYVHQCWLIVDWIPGRNFNSVLIKIHQFSLGKGCLKYFQWNIGQFILWPNGLTATIIIHPCINWSPNPAIVGDRVTHMCVHELGQHWFR